MLPDGDPLWYKDAIIYELHVKAYHDSTGDGIGDLPGLIQKLDYLEGLGVTAIWLLPFYPSPLRDDGYDIADYFTINPDYGLLNDFKVFLKEAHNRGLRVITELVINHTSDQHPWFQRARRAKPGSVWRDFYVWSDKTEKYRDARIIFKDFEKSNWSWDQVANAYYWHRFYSHQPDLNFDNPRVQKEIIRVMDFWFEMGVDGLRLDAVPYLYEREGTTCENLPETYAFLQTLRAHVDSKFTGRMLLAEANQWPEDAAAYFGDGDRCHMAFHFPVMPRMFMGLRREDRFPIIDILEQTPSIPESCQWAMFLRNHDELTLEMVTDEERDYMYRVYAKDPHAKINLGIRRRLAPLLDNNRRKIELMTILLFSLPGTPVIYYGDEIGMGDNYYLGDRDGVRTPMQWSPDRNAGFSKANPHKLYLPVIIDPEYHYEAVNVETQEGNLSSLLWWMKRVIAMRKRFKSFGRGSLEFLAADNSKVLAFSREYEGERIVVIVNLSRFSQVVELDLARYVGFVPNEVFSQNRFPVIRARPYVVTLGPYDHYWLLLKRERGRSSAARGRTIPELHIKGNWDSLFDGSGGKTFEDEILPDYLRGSRWFSGKGRAIRSVQIIENLPLYGNGGGAHLLACQVVYTEGTPEFYLVPVSFAPDDQSKRAAREAPDRIIATIHSSSGKGILYDSVHDEVFRASLLSLVARRKKIKGKSGELVGYAGRNFRKVAGDKDPALDSRLLGAEQSNTSMVYENKLFLKLYRRFDEGISPDAEISRFLTEKTRFQNVPVFAGSIEYRRAGAEPVAVAMLQGYTPSEGDAWSLTVDSVGRYFERVLSMGDQVRKPPRPFFSVSESEGVSPEFEEVMAGFYLEMVDLLGKRTAEMHLALASAPDDPDFAPEPYSLLYQRSIFQSMRSQVKMVFPLLQSNLRKLPVDVADEAEKLLAAERQLLECQARILEKKISAMKIRVHGDYHLGQVMFTGKDFVIIDFEGEPARPSTERRLKRTPLKDVAGMMRSFHYAGYSALLQRGHVRTEDQPLLEPWVGPWSGYVGNAFLKSYLDGVSGSGLLPTESSEIEILLQTLLLDKAVYELGYEINNRPDWVLIPIRGITSILANWARGG
jgi:maltose alpha-D-glucosyltransferase / alpha-amylase